MGNDESENESGDEKPKSNNDDEEDDPSEKEEEETSCSKSKKKQAKPKEDPYYIPYRPKDLVFDRGDDPIDNPNTDNHNTDNENYCNTKCNAKLIESKLIQTLKAWSTNNNLDHAKAVRNMLAAWHPDKVVCNNEKKALCKDVFQTLQSEVNKLKKEKERREKKFEIARAKREQALMQKTAEKQAKASIYGQKGSAQIVKKPTTQIEAKKEEKTTPISDSDDDDAPPPQLVQVEAMKGETDTTPKRVFPPLIENSLGARSHFTMTRSGEDSIVLFGGEYCEEDVSQFRGEMYQIRHSIVNEKDGDARNEDLPFKDCLQFTQESLYTPVLGIDGPCARSAHQTCVYKYNSGEYLYFLFGGEWSSPDGRRFKQFDDFWVYVSRNQKWLRIKDSSNGNSNNPNYSKKIAASSCTNNSNNFPTARSGHRMVMLDTKIYLFGGFNELKNGNVKYLNDFFYCDVQEIITKFKKDSSEDSSEDILSCKKDSSEDILSCLWIRDKRKNERPGSRSGFCMWGDEKRGKIWIYGGRNSSKTWSDLWSLTLCNQTWNKVDAPKWITGRSGLALTTGIFEIMGMKRDVVYFYGGVTDNDKKNVSIFHSDLSALDLETGICKKIWSAVDDCTGNNTGTGLSGNSADEISPNVSETATKKMSESLSEGGYDLAVLNFKKSSGFAFSQNSSSNNNNTNNTNYQSNRASKKSTRLGGESNEKLDFDLDLPFPRGRIGAQIISVGETYLFLYGGSCEAGIEKDFTMNDSWVFSIKERRWECISKLTPPEEESESEEEGDQFTMFRPNMSMPMSTCMATISGETMAAMPLLSGGPQKTIISSGNTSGDTPIVLGQPTLATSSSMPTVPGSPSMQFQVKSCLKTSLKKEDSSKKAVSFVELNVSLASNSDHESNNESDEEIPTLVRVTNIVEKKEPGKEDSGEESSEVEEVHEQKGGKKLSKKAQKKANKEAEKQLQKESFQTVREANENADHCGTVALVDVVDPTHLRKKERLKWEKKQRQEVKIVKQMEKEAKKNSKKEAKVAAQKEAHKNGKKRRESSDLNDQ